MLTVTFGAPKFGLPWSDPDANLRFFEVAYWFPNDIAKFGGVFAWAPGPLAWLAAFSEAVGGIALAIGFASRLFALLLLATMLGAMFLQQWKQGLWNMLPALGFSWFAWYTLVLGAGRISVDHLLTRKRP